MLKILDVGVPVLVPQKRIRLRTMRWRVRSLASLSGLRIRRCRELWCRWQKRFGSRVAVAVVEAGGYSSDSTPSLGTSMCPECGPKKTEDTKTLPGIRHEAQRFKPGSPGSAKRKVRPLLPLLPGPAVRQEKPCRCFFIHFSSRGALPRLCVCAHVGIPVKMRAHSISGLSFVFVGSRAE